MPINRSFEQSKFLIRIMDSGGKLNCQGKRALIFSDKQKNTDELAQEAAQVINARFKELIEF